METLTIGEGVQEIGNYAFLGARSLRKVELPDSLTKIGGYAFSGCYVLSEVRFPEKMEMSGIGAGSFTSTGMEDIILPDGTSSLEYWAARGLKDETVTHSTYQDGWEYLKISNGTGLLVGWRDYRKLEDDPTVVIPEQLGDVRITEIGPNLFGMFNDKTRSLLKKVVLPEGLKVIRRKAFLRCGELQEINLPDSLEKIDFFALAGVKAEGLELPENAREQSDAMWYCTTIRKDASGEFEYGILSDGTAVITAIEVGKKNQITVPAEVDGIRVSMISQIPPNGKSGGINGYDNLKNVKISEGIESVSTAAFEECKNLKNIQLPKSLKTIGNGAFSHCESLNSIQLPNGLEEIKDSAFSYSGVKNIQLPDSLVKTGQRIFGNSALTGVTIPKTWTAIPDSLFESVKELKSVNIPKGITRIGKNAFAFCTSLSNVNLPEGLLSIGENAFRQNVDSVQRQYVQTDGKKPLTALKSMKFPASLETIEKNAFAGCDALTNISFPKNAQLKEIGEHSFAVCVRLKEISLPDGLEKIGDSAFVNCLALQKANLGKGLLEIGPEAFLHDNAMTSLTVPDTVSAIGDRAIEDHHEKLTVTCGQDSAMENWLKAHYPEVTVAYPKK